MARPLTGQIRVRRLRDGTEVFDARIREDQHTIGRSPRWTQKNAQTLLDAKLLPMAMLGQPWWEAIPGEEDRSSPPVTVDTLTVGDVLSEYLHMVEVQPNKNTRNATVSPIMNHVGPAFVWDGPRERTVAELSGSLVSDFCKAKQREREILTELSQVLRELDDTTLQSADALRAQLDGREWEFLMRYGMRGGRWRASDPEASGRFSLSTRGLSNNEINRCLALLRRALHLAENEHRLFIGDPTHRRGLPPEAPDRSWVRPDGLQAMFDAAVALDAGATLNGRVSRTLGRYEICVVLALAGPRATETCRARWEHRRHEELHIPHSKTASGTRDIYQHPLVRAVLTDRWERLGRPSRGLIFPTEKGGVRDRNSLRNRILDPVVAHARELLAQRGQDPLPDRVTPHTLRRTYLTYLAWSGESVQFARQQAGHKDSRMTLEVYQQSFPAKLDPRVPVWVHRET